MIEEVLRKIDQTPTPQVRRAALAFSGGLDSSLCVELLRRKYRAQEIVPISVDVGQGQEEIEQIRQKAQALGIDPVIVDAREEFSQDWVRRAIQANADYMGYPVATSMTRQLIARKVAELALQLGCDAIVEGSSGKGNDQYRMHNVFKLFAPGLEVLVPVRDFDLTREEEEELCRHWGVPVSEVISGGDDKTIWCRSIASGALGLNQSIPEEVWMWYRPPRQAPEEGEEVTLEFKRGVPVALDGRGRPLLEILDELNHRAGRQGVGKIDIVEEGIMGLKSRELYEAPAAVVILKVHRDLEQLCLTKDELAFKAMVDHRWAHLVYHGMAYHPLKEGLDAFIERSQRPVEGCYRVGLYRGNVEILERSSPRALFFPELRSIKEGGFDQRICAHAARIFGLTFETLARRGQ